MGSRRGHSAGAGVADGVAASVEAVFEGGSIWCFGGFAFQAGYTYRDEDYEGGDDDMVYLT